MFFNMLINYIIYFSFIDYYDYIYLFNIETCVSFLQDQTLKCL